MIALIIRRPHMDMISNNPQGHFVDPVFEYLSSLKSPFFPPLWFWSLISRAIVSIPDFRPCLCQVLIAPMFVEGQLTTKGYFGVVGRDILGGCTKSERALCPEIY
jgi:hypothetical protein